MTITGPAARIASIHVYPLKACRAVDVGQARVEPWGLAGDRRWLLVERTGRFISQREEPTLALVTVRYADGCGTITVSAAGHQAQSVAAPSEAGGAEMLRVTVWDEPVLAAAAGCQADAWFSRYLGRPVRLVYLDDPTRRAVDQDYGAAGDVVSFADGYPLLLTSTSSLDVLCDWLVSSGDEPVPMNRFRPSVVVAGADPWAEDGWSRVRIGGVSFRVAKPCGRCVVTTIDQATAERGRQPLMMLGRRRRFGQELVFGQNLIPDTPGRIQVGDPVEILEQVEGPG
jgi:uncharacterized protein YcbX